MGAFRALVRYVSIRILASLWLMCVAAGSVVLVRHQNAPGPAREAPEIWPQDTLLPLDRERPTLVMFAHPHCPCTRTSINELNRLLARCPNRVAVHVLFRTLDKSSRTAGTSKAAAALPGVRVHQDVDGAEARRFGAITSGHTVLYNRNGRLLFRGGITAGRGHEGDNAGADSIVALVAGAASAAQYAPVYGCRLFSECEEECEELCAK